MIGHRPDLIEVRACFVLVSLNPDMDAGIIL